MHILNQVIWAESDYAEARELAAVAHAQLGYKAENATWRNAYLSATQELRDGLPQGEKNHRALRDVFKGMDPVLLLNSMSICLNGPKAHGHALTINWIITDTGSACHSELSNSVLLNRAGATSAAHTSVELPRALLKEFALGEIDVEALEQRGAKVTGDASLLAELENMFDQFRAWFPIVIHDPKFEEAELLP